MLRAPQEWAELLRDPSLAAHLSMLDATSGALQRGAQHLCTGRAGDAGLEAVMQSLDVFPQVGPCAGHGAPGLRPTDCIF